MSVETRPSLSVVAALMYRADRLLICRRRADGAFPLKWEFPGGKVENGESDVEALRRELREELAVETGEVSRFRVYEHAYPNGPTVSLRFYRVIDFAGEPQNLIFHEIVWAKVSELDHYDFLDGDQPIIAQLMADGGTGSL